MNQIHGLALISYLAQASPAKWIGRTALMKLLYFLQEARDVPLGYHFTLYSYGPFDAAVLNDLGGAEALGLVRSTLEAYSTGYGYRIESDIDAEDVTKLGGDLLREHKGDIDWVLAEFGSKTAADLELESTIVFVERETSRGGEQVPIESIVGHVHDVKPHFKETEIKGRVEALMERGLLHNVTPS